jgi:hypothetical protein
LGQQRLTADRSSIGPNQGSTLVFFETYRNELSPKPKNVVVVSTGISCLSTQFTPRGLFFSKPVATDQNVNLKRPVSIF